MRTTAKLLVLVAAFAVVTAACSSDDSGGGETISVAVENAYVPFNYIDDDGNAAGFDYDIFREICDRIGCEAEFVEAGWPAVIEETGQGLYDVAADGITITDERKATVDFSDPYMITDQKFMIVLDETRFGTAQELIDGDYVVGTQEGTTNFETAVGLVGENRINAFQDFGIAVQALLAGDVDAVMIDDVAGQGYQGVNASQLRLLPESQSSDPLGFIFPKGSTLTARVNEALADMTADGTLDDLIKKWFIDFEA